MHNILKPWVAWIAIILLAFGAAIYVYFCALGTQGVYKMKIGDCTNNLIESYIHFPACHGFQVILDPGFDAKTEKNLTASCVFSGHCYILSNKTEIARFQIIESRIIELHLS